MTIKPYYSEPGIEIYHGDCRDILPHLPKVDLVLTDLEVGRAGEYLVAADLLLSGYGAFLTAQGLSCDIILEANGRLFKVQVKTTRKPIPVPNRKKRTQKYCFNVRRCGKNGRRSYRDKEVDLFALVAIDSREIGYIPAENAKQTMFFLPVGSEPIRKTGSYSQSHLSDFTIDLALKGISA